MRIFKKTISCAISVLLAVGVLVVPVSAASKSNTDTVESSIKAASAVLMEASTGRILYEKNAHEQLPPASITKIMSLILICEAIENGDLSLDQKITCSESAASMGGSQIWLEPGEEMSVRDLLKATVIKSSNDSTVLLAECVAGSEEAFVTMMNKRATDLGMKNTVFKNASGLDDDGHLSSAYDVAIMSRELIKHDIIFEYTTVWMDYLRDGKMQLVNTNKLVRSYKGITGLKTGTTDGAGYCLSATAQRNNMHLIAVVMGSDTSDDRFSSAKKLLDYGFANWKTIVLTPSIDIPKYIKVLKGQSDTVAISPEEIGYVLLPKGQEDRITQKLTICEDVEAPVEKGQTVGKLEFFIDGEELCVYSIKADYAVKKMDFVSAFLLFIKAIFILK